MDESLKFLDPQQLQQYDSELGNGLGSFASFDMGPMSALAKLCKLCESKETFDKARRYRGKGPDAKQLRTLAVTIQVLLELQRLSGPMDSKLKCLSKEKVQSDLERAASMSHDIRNWSSKQMSKALLQTQVDESDADIDIEIINPGPTTENNHPAAAAAADTAPLSSNMIAARRKKPIPEVKTWDPTALDLMLLQIQSSLLAFLGAYFERVLCAFLYLTKYVPMINSWWICSFVLLVAILYVCANPYVLRIFLIYVFKDVPKAIVKSMWNSLWSSCSPSHELRNPEILMEEALLDIIAAATMLTLGSVVVMVFIITCMHWRGVGGVAARNSS